jgi:hypothetical protein
MPDFKTIAEPEAELLRPLPAGSLTIEQIQ